MEGLNKRPTLINNVETLSQVSYIVNHGADEYRKIGTENSKGTKVFALAGKVRHGGLIEVPMGTTLEPIIGDIGGGVEGGEKLRAVQISGPSGGCIPAHLCDAKVDLTHLSKWERLWVPGNGRIEREQLYGWMWLVISWRFTCNESCGKCTFCRVGIRRMLDILDKLCTGKAEMADIDKLEELALRRESGSLRIGEDSAESRVGYLEIF